MNSRVKSAMVTFLFSFSSLILSTPALAAANPADVSKTCVLVVEHDTNVYCNYCFFSNGGFSKVCIQH